MSAAPASRSDRRTQAARARAAFLSRFATPEERKSYFHELAERSAEARRERVTLTPEQVGALHQAYTLLRQIACVVQEKANAAAANSGAAEKAEARRARVESPA
jgi:hypothetical protein